MKNEDNCTTNRIVFNNPRNTNFYVFISTENIVIKHYEDRKYAEIGPLFPFTTLGSAFNSVIRQGKDWGNGQYLTA